MRGESWRQGACQGCRTMVKDWNGSDPNCAFPNDGTFTSDNWSCPTAGLIRSIGFDLECWPPGLDEPYGATLWWSEDQHYLHLLIDEVLTEEGERIGACLWASWYKHRGQTMAMWVLDEYEEPRLPTATEVRCIAEHWRARLEEAA